jgi:hypothetical protein
MKPTGAILMALLIVLTGSATVLAFPPPGGIGGPRPAPGAGSKPANTSPQPPPDPAKGFHMERRRESPSPNTTGGGGGGFPVLPTLLCFGSLFFLIAIGVGLVVFLWWMTEKKNRARPKRAVAHLPCDDLPEPVEARWNRPAHR